MTDEPQRRPAGDDRRGDRARRHRPGGRRGRPAGRARPGGVRRAGRGHRPVRRQGPGGRQPRPTSAPGPTWWWWPWSTTNRSWPCSTATTARWPPPAPGSTVVDREHRVAAPRVEAIGGRWPCARDVDVARLRGERRARGRRPRATLVSMVGGDAAVIERVRPVLDAFSSLVVPMGPLGCRAQGQAGPQPRAVRVVAGRLRGPGAGRGGRDRAGQAGRGDQGERQLHRRGVEAHVPRHRRPLPARHRSPALVGAMAAGAALAHKDLRRRHRAGRSRSASTCPWPP